MFDVVLWDLDGTVTKSEEGIFNSIEYAAEKFGLPTPERKLLRPFIGPPLQYSFQKFFNLSDGDGARMVAYYREYYASAGIFECEVYDGVREALALLRSAGRTLALATSKPEKFACAILEHFGLSDMFSRVFGADMSPHSADKALIVARALDGCAVNQKSRAVMVGDKMHDVAGAKSNGIKCIGVLYGYGGKQELEESGADYLAQTPQDVADIVLNRKQR